MNPPPTAAPFHAVHVRFHQQDAAPAAFFHVLIQRRIGHSHSFKSRPLIFDDHIQLLCVDAIFELNFFLGSNRFPCFIALINPSSRARRTAKWLWLSKPYRLQFPQNLILNITHGRKIGIDGQLHRFFHCNARLDHFLPPWKRHPKYTRAIGNNPMKNSLQVKLSIASVRLAKILKTLFSLVVTNTSMICGLIFASRSCPFLPLMLLSTLISIPSAADVM